MTPRSRHPPAVQYPLQRSAVLGALLVFWLLGSAMVLAALVGVGARAAWAAGGVAPRGAWGAGPPPVLGFGGPPPSAAPPGGGAGPGVGTEPLPGRFHGHF